MAEFLTTKQALSAIEDVIDGAREKLVLLSPYQRIGSSFRARIAAATKRGVRLTVVYGRQDADRDQLLELAELPKARVLYSERLHAKCYFNETMMVITSLNLLVSSEQNWEMGVRLRAGDDAYRAALREADLIIAEAVGQRPAAAPRGREQPPSYRRGGAEIGFCIRGRAKLPFNPDRPFCDACYASWAQWQNWDYLEQWCHNCGTGHATSRARPVCYACFRILTTSP